MAPEQIAILMFVALLVLVMAGHSLAFTIGGIAMFFGILWWGELGVFGIFAKTVYGTMSNYLYAAITLFIFMGAMMERSGIGESLYSALHVVTGRLRGSLALVTIFICTLLAASTGIAATSVVGMGLVALPQMLKRGYNKELATGTIMAGGCLGILIPPSVMLVVMAENVGLSVGKLFAGALFPGLILSALYMTFISAVCFFKPSMGPALPREETAIPLTKKATLTLTSLIPPIGLVVCVLGSILLGVASPTEASGVGAIGAMVIAAAHRKLNWRVVKDAAYATIISCGMIIWILVGAICYSAVFLGLRGGDFVQGLLLGTTLSPLAILAVMLFVIFLLGMIMEWIGIFFITAPIFFPIATAIGYDSLFFAILVAMTFQTAFLTPPYGGALFLLKGIAPEGVTMSNIFRGAYIFIPLQLVGLALCIIYPQIVLWLPALLFK